MSDMNNPSDENTGALDDLWADALNEQKATTTKSAADAVFQQLGGGDVSGAMQDIDLIMDIPVKLTVQHVAARRLFFSTAKRPALTGRFVIGLRPARAFPCLARAHSHGMPPALRQNHHTSDTLPFRWNNR